MSKKEIYLGLGVYVSGLQDQPLLRLRANKPSLEYELLIDKQVFTRLKKIGKRYFKKRGILHEAQPHMRRRTIVKTKESSS